MPWSKEVARRMCHAGIVPQVQLLGDNITWLRLRMVGAMGDAAAGLASSVAPTDSRSPAMQLHYYCYY